MRWQKRARGAGLQGPTGTWGAGRGRQNSQRRDGRWRSVGVDTCSGGQVFQDRKRGGNQVQRSVQISLGVVDGRGVGTWGVAGNDPENS